MKKRAAIVAAAVACLVLGALLALLAADILRWRDALRADDVRYRATPGVDDLWNPAALVPLGATQNMLGIDDDLAFRRAVRALRLAKLEEASSSDPKLVLQRADAQARLEAIVAAGGDPVRRSRAMTLLGVLQLALPTANPEERATVLKVAVANLQEAVTLDPDNDDAKYNLEVALRRSRGVQTVQGGPAPNPSTGPGSSKGAATGPPGKGY
jgi:hypothetical protein